MKRIIVLIVAVLICVVGKTQSITPEVIATAGDYFIGTNATLSWTLGEVITETVSSSSYTLTQGFQQPYYNITSINEDPKLKENDPLADINVYPNPVNDQLNIDFKNLKEQNLMIVLIDLQGKVLLSDFAENTLTVKQINMLNIAKGNYILRVSTRDGQHLKSFKIIKY
jgi:hypothetical protein